MKPYYEHAGITIYHGDCREILPQLAADSVDLLVTDPPYGVNWESNFRQQSFGVIAGDDSRATCEAALELTLRVLQNRRHAYIFGRWDLSKFPISGPVELIWDKENMGMGNLESPWGNQHEYIQFFVSVKQEQNRKDGAGGLACRLRRGSVLRYLRPNGSRVDTHPTEKPTSLIRELIESSSRIGETVLDCFMGSGSTMEAAKIEGRSAIGIEIEEQYCETAANRLSQEMFNFETCTDERGQGPSSTCLEGTGS